MFFTYEGGGGDYRVYRHIHLALLPETTLVEAKYVGEAAKKYFGEYAKLNFPDLPT